MSTPGLNCDKIKSENRLVGERNRMVHIACRLTRVRNALNKCGRTPNAMSQIFSCATSPTTYCDYIVANNFDVSGMNYLSNVGTFKCNFFPIVGFRNLSSYDVF